jgi:hypothetical protein
VIEPHGGEINYELASKNPAKFYDQVINQDITKHKVRPNKQMTLKREEEQKKLEEDGSPMRKMKKQIPLEVRSKITKRGLFKIFQKVRVKLMQQFMSNIGAEYEPEIENALQDPKIEKQIQLMMKQDKIHLLNERNEPIYQKEIHQFAENAEKSNAKKRLSKDINVKTKAEINSEDDENNSGEDDDDEDVSPDFRSKTKLVHSFFNNLLLENGVARS